MRMQLKIELIPERAFGANLRRTMSRQGWDTLRKTIYKLYGYCCAVCGGKGPRHPVECHEVWRFRLKTATQTLVGLEALCPMCHAVKHYGRSALLGNDERVKDLHAWLAAVNDMTRKQVIKYIDTCFHIWSLKSNGVDRWKIEYQYLRDFAAQHIMCSGAGSLNPRGAQNACKPSIDIPADGYAVGKACKRTSHTDFEEDDGDFEGFYFF